ncbi:MAG: DUF177 domain-containing protein [Candidatus Krumholzibacteria bacterium]|nr:DUF177 domain-containing protein [Candidatus Krumholzibacteria bacterium]
MILDLEKVSADERISGDEVVVFQDVAGQENQIHCHIELGLRKIGDTFYIHVDLSGSFSTACHKCLEPARYEVTPSFEVVVQKAGQAAGSEPGSGEEDFVRLPIGQTRLSLDQHIYENLVVNIPMRISCSDRCRGLCPACGVNLNREDCRCTAAADPRWNELRKLGEKSSE